MYSIHSVKIWLFTAVLCIQTSFLFGQNKNFYVNRIAPAWTVKIDSKVYKVKAKDVSDGYYMGLVEKQNHVELKEEYRHYIREIISQAGVQNGSEISVTYDPGFQKLTFHKIIIWRNNHPIDKLVAGNFKILQNEKELSKFIYSGTFDAYLILDDVRKGDRIEYAYTIKGQNPIFGDKYANIFYFEGSSSYGHEYTNLIVSNKRKLTFKNFNFNDKLQSHDVSGMRIYEWESTNTQTHRTADFEPSWYVAEKFTQVSEYQSWSDVVNWGLKVNSYADLKTPTLDKKVRQLHALAGNSQEKYIELATRFVQDEIRYMGIEMGEYSQRPNSPEKVLAQRYGDCKDKSLLLIYLLNRQNIDAYMAYVDTYSGKRTRDFLPSPFLFDHAVVVVEHNNVKTWIDPTISSQRGTFKSIYFPNYGQALVIKPGNEKPEEVISIPTGKLVANLHFILPDTIAGKKSTLVINSTYSDNYADNIRSTIEDQGTDGLEKSFREYISKYYPDIENKGNIIIKNDPAENTINITETYLIDNIWLKPEKANANKYIYFYGDLIDAELRTVKDKNRKAPLALKYPVNVEENIFIQLPAPWKYENQTTKVESDNYYFEFSTFSKGNTLRFNYSYRNFKDHVNPADIKQYIKDAKKIGNNLSAYIYYGGGGMDSDGKYNSNFIVLTLMFVTASSFHFIRKYRAKTPYNLQEILTAPPIRGWLIVLAFSIILGPYSLLFDAARRGLFEQLTANSDSNTVEVLVVFARIIKLACFAIAFNWSVLSTSLFFNRRQNFPKQFVHFMFFQYGVAAFTLCTDLLQDSLTHETTVTGKYLLGKLFGICISVLVVFYIKRSERVKKTFVFTYPDLPWKTDRIKHTNALITGTFVEEKEPVEL